MDRVNSISDSVKNIFQTMTAVSIVLVASYNFYDGHLEDKIYNTIDKVASSDKFDVVLKQKITDIFQEFAEEQQLDGKLEEKIQKVARITAHEAYNRIRVDDAVIVLDKAAEKFRSGKSESIRKTNLEQVLKYHDQISEYYPEKRIQLKWCVRYYEKHFVDGFSESSYAIYLN